MKHFVALLILLISTSVFADSSHPTHKGAEFELFTPWSFIHGSVAQYFNGNTIRDQRDLSAVTLQLGQWTPHLSGVHSNLTTKANLVSMSSQGLELKTQQLSLNLTIDKVSIDQIIKQTVGTTTINIHVQAECGPFTISQPAANMDMQLSYAVLPHQIQTKVGLVTLQWAPNSWQLGPIKCSTGPIGFDHTLSDELSKDLSNAQNIKPWLQDIMTQKLQEESDSLLTQLAQPIPVAIQNATLPLMLDFRSLQNTPDGVLASGALIWSSNSAEIDIFPLPNRAVPSDVAAGSTPTMLTPSEGWSGLIEAERQAKGPTFAVNMQKIQAFHDLLKSPMQLSFVWPDLNYFTADSPFTLRVSSPTAYSLQWKNDGSASVATPVNAVIRAIRDEQTWNYVRLGGSVSGQLQLKINNGVLTTMVKVSKSSFSATFDPAYVTAFNPNTYISDRVLSGLQDYVNQGFTNTSDLPPMKLGPFGSAVFNGWQGKGQGVVALPIKVIQN